MSSEDNMRERRSGDVETARARSVARYRRLVEEMFSNILNDTGVVLEASMAFVETAEIAGEPEDKEHGEHMVRIVGTMEEIAAMLRDRYIEVFDGAAIKPGEWRKLDRVLAETPEEDAKE